MGGLIDAEAFYAPVPHLRPATLDDLALLVRHRRAMWEDIGGYSQGDLDDADPVYRRWLRPRMISGAAAAWVSEDRGTAAASGVLWVQRVQPRPRHPSGLTPYLMSMYTEPAHRGRGHAKRIVEAAMRWTRERGYPRMTLHASEAGRPIYEKLGFTRTWEMKLEQPPPARSAGSRR